MELSHKFTVGHIYNTIRTSDVCLEMTAIAALGALGALMFGDGKDSLSDGVDSSHLNEERNALTSPQTHTNNHPQNDGEQQFAVDALFSGTGKSQNFLGSGKIVDWKSLAEGAESLITTGRLCDAEHGCIRSGPGASKIRPGDDTISSLLPGSGYSSVNLLKPPDVTGFCENDAFQVSTDGGLSKYRLRTATEAQIMAIGAPPTFDPAKWGDHHERERFWMALGHDEAVAKALTSHNCIIDWDTSPGPPETHKLYKY